MTAANPGAKSLVPGIVELREPSQDQQVELRSRFLDVHGFREEVRLLAVFSVSAVV